MDKGSHIIKRYSQEKPDENLSCASNVEHARLEPGQCVLDIGCGLGKEVIKFAQQVGPSGMAFGIDITSNLIKEAQKNVQKKNIDNVQFGYADMENLTFQDNMFDKIFSNCVINHASDKLKVFQEIFRVLKAGGEIVISDAVSQEPLPAEVKNDPEAWAQCFGGAVTYLEYQQILLKIGFTNIKVLKKRDYLKEGYSFSSITFTAVKNNH